MDWHDVGPVSDFESGSARRVQAGGAFVAVFRSADRWIAAEDRCPHMRAPLSEGTLRNGDIVCAWHGWRFDGTTGACALGAGLPGVAVREVRVEGGRVCVGPARSCGGEAGRGSPVT